MSLCVSDVDFGEQNIIYVTAPDKDKTYGVEWTVPATESLIDFLKSYLKLFITGKLKTKKQIYENVSAAMEEKGMFYSSQQCENKWKSLKRTYIARYEKGNSANKRLIFAAAPYIREVEELLKIERPSFKQELDSQYNLNVPPGFSKTEPASGSENEVEEEEHAYTDKDAELVQMILSEPHHINDSISKDNKISIKLEPCQPQGKIEEHSYSYANNFQRQDSHELVDEVIELRKVVRKNLNATTEVLRNHNTTQEQIMTYLDTLEKREEEKMEIKRRKLDKQGEIVQQLKIQNSLIAKLIQKLGSKKD